MSWLRLDADYHADGTLRRCKSVMWWPLILCAMKRGGGVASDDDIAPEVLADIGQGREEDAAAAIAKLKAAGKLIPVDGGWTTPNWFEMQPDPTNSERQRRWRERNAAASREASAAVTVTDRNGYITSRNEEKRSVTPDRTGQDIHTEPQREDVVVTTPRAHEHTPAPAHTREQQPPPPPPPPVDVLEAWRDATNGMFTPPAEITKLVEMAREYSPETVMRAIGEAVESNKEKRITLNFVRSIAARLHNDRGAPGRTVNGVWQNYNPDDVAKMPVVDF